MTEDTTITQSTYVRIYHHNPKYVCTYIVFDILPEEMYTTFTCLRVMPVEKTELTATNVRLGAFSLSRGKFAVCLVCSAISFIPDRAWVQGFANYQGVFLPILQTQL